MTQTTIQQSTDLRKVIYTTDSEGNSIKIQIRLNDECKNGHQDFAITATIWEKGKPKTDRYFIAGGCCHDEIIKAMPELQIFVNLHLCDWEGVPMYAVENGFYHLVEGFNNMPPTDSNFKGEFCQYYRVTANQFHTLQTAKNKIQYALMLQNLGILNQWKEEANKAILLLEEMTETQFLPASEKSQYHAPTKEEIAEDEKKTKEGYYTKEAEAQRANQKQVDIIAKMKAELNKKAASEKQEFDIKVMVLIAGGEKALNNCIFYNHSQTLAFNWKRYEKLTEDEIEAVISNINLPKGVKVETKG